jgi:hypothetical protein
MSRQHGLAIEGCNTGTVNGKPLGLVSLSGGRISAMAVTSFVSKDNFRFFNFIGVEVGSRRKVSGRGRRPAGCARTAAPKAHPGGSPSALNLFRLAQTYLCWGLQGPELKQCR